MQLVLAEHLYDFITDPLTKSRIEFKQSYQLNITQDNLISTKF